MKKILTASAAVAGGIWLWKFKGRTTEPNVDTPGRKKMIDTHLLEAGAAILQGKAPLSAMKIYLDGFHFYADNMGKQMEAHHYCNQVNEDFIQCAVFDGNTRGARLIGVEYIVSERLFRRLPQEEKKLWHSHHYEVKSGTLVAAGIPEVVERKLMKKVVSTYGKVWHTWDTAKDDLPLGIPALMMGFTADGQADPEMIRRRDERFGISSETRKEKRRHIAMPEVAPGANFWETGSTLQTHLQEMEAGYIEA